MQGEIMERGKAARRQAILLLAASSNAGGDRKPAPRRWRNNAGLRPIRRPGSSSLQWDQPRSRGGGEGEDPGPSGFKIRSLFGLSCSASSASLVQVHAMSVRMERTLRFGARSAICRHSTARCLHSTGVIIDTQPNAPTDQEVASRHYTTTATGLPICNAVGMKKLIDMSRIPDRRAALAPRFRLMEPAPVGLAQPITMPQPREGARPFGRWMRCNPSHLSGRRLPEASSVDNISVQADAALRFRNGLGRR
jgi:hypothetical protein